MAMARRPMSFPRKYPRRTCGGRAFLVIVALALMTFFLLVLTHKQPKFLGVATSIFFTEFGNEFATDNMSLGPTDMGEPIPDVSALIEVIRNATKKAAGRHGPADEFTEADRAKWRKKNPCKSRAELASFYTRRRFVKHVGASPKWAAVLAEYTELHRACTRRVGGDAAAYFLARNDRAGCKFAVAGGPKWAGLGNKVLPTLAVLLYAVLTQRVLLVPAASHLPGIMCEPFEGSSWGVDPDELFTPIESHDGLWTSYGRFEELVDNAMSRRPRRGAAAPPVYAVRVAHWCQPVERFFCDTEQAFYARVPWVYFTSCVNFMPKLFAIPAFRPVLEDLFPDRMATTHLVRSVMMPADAVWRRVESADRMYLGHADRRIGVQIRYRLSIPQFEQYHEMVNANLLRCAWNFGVLPDVNGSSRISSIISGDPNEIRARTAPVEAESSSGDITPSSLIRIAVFVTSLFPSLRDHLAEVYHRNPPNSGGDVGIFQLSHGQIQGFGMEEDTQALAEVLCLSFSDDLFVTPLSTFGGLAQAYGALTPYFLEFRNDSALPPCQRGRSVESCYQDPGKTYACPHDWSRLNGKLITDVVPYVKDCPTIDAANGLQLITVNLQDST